MSPNVLLTSVREGGRLEEVGTAQAHLTWLTCESRTQCQKHKPGIQTKRNVIRKKTVNLLSSHPKTCFYPPPVKKVGPRWVTKIPAPTVSAASCRMLTQLEQKLSTATKRHADSCRKNETIAVIVIFIVFWLYLLVSCLCYICNCTFGCWCSTLK
jgi:hypothetical protein